MQEPVGHCTSSCSSASRPARYGGPIPDSDKSKNGKENQNQRSPYDQHNASPWWRYQPSQKPSRSREALRHPLAFPQNRGQEVQGEYDFQLPMMGASRENGIFYYMTDTP